MQDLAKLSELAAIEIDTLLAEGITPTPAEIVELSALGWNSEDPQMRLALSRGIPSCAGDVTFWPLTIEAAEWFDRVGCHILSGRAALAYASAHCYADGRPFDCSGAMATARVMAWWVTLGLRRATVDEALDQIVQQDETYALPPRPNGRKRKTMSAGEISCTLAATCGGSVEFWESRCASSYAFEALRTAIAQASESGSMEDDAKIKATQALGWAVEKIRNRHHGRG